MEDVEDNKGDEAKDERTAFWVNRKDDEDNRGEYLVSWCFELSQRQRVTSGLRAEDGIDNVMNAWLWQKTHEDLDNLLSTA